MELRRAFLEHFWASLVEKSGIAPDVRFPKAKPHIFRVQEVLGEAFGTIFGELGFKNGSQRTKLVAKCAQMCQVRPTKRPKEAKMSSKSGFDGKSQTEDRRSTDGATVAGTPREGPGGGKGRGKWIFLSGLITRRRRVS